MLLPDGRDGTRTLLAGYNSDDDLTSLTLPGGAQHTLSYTPVDALESYAPPALGTGNVVTQYEYDADGRVELETRPDGATIAYGYDNAGRLHTTTYPQGMITRGYDPTTGKLASIASPSGVSLAFGYDGILAKSTTWSGTVTGSVLLGYDATFRTTSQVLNGGAALSFGYDDDNLMTQAGALTLTRDPQSGRVTGSTLGSTADAYTYDANGMFANYTARFSGTVVYSESVGARDNVGRITQRTEIAGGATHVWGYSYDTAGRLMDVTEDGTAVSHYEYDADDNRITFTNASGTVHPVYDAQDRLLTYGNATYTYGANGELESKEVGGQTTTYEYDVFGNLLHVDSPSGSVLDYIIDGQNRRVGKKVGGVLTAGFLYQEPLKVVAQLDPSGSVAARFVFGTKANVPDYFTSAAGTFRILSDHLGSPRMIVDVSTGSVVEEIDYDEFGNVTNDTAPGTIPFGFGGGFFDKDAALVRFGARDYDPGTGRWTAKDPSRFAGGTNLYGYAVNDPINGIDPSGLYVVFIGIGAEATVGAGGGGSIGAYFDTDIFNIWNPSTWASGAGLYISGQLSFGLDVGAGVCGGVTKDQSTFFGKGYGVGAAGPTYGADVLFTPVDGPVDAEGNQMAGGTPTGGQISRGFAGFGVSGLPAGAHVFISGTAPLLQ
jgi:RHS repeat-associated protein